MKNIITLILFAVTLGAAAQKTDTTGTPIGSTPYQEYFYSTKPMPKVKPVTSGDHLLSASESFIFSAAFMFASAACGVGSAFVKEDEQKKVAVIAAGSTLAISTVFMVRGSISLSKASVRMNAREH